MSESAWLLPATKTDHRAVGAARTWDCCCGVAAMGRACPVHALLRQREKVSQLAERIGAEAPTLPLFPDERGDEVEKTAMVALIYHVVGALGLPAQDDSGCWLYGGHSLRTGPIFWPRRGKPV